MLHQALTLAHLGWRQGITLVRIQFKEGENPYANKRNTLTPTQMRKRKRLMKHIKKNK